MNISAKTDKQENQNTDSAFGYHINFNTWWLAQYNRHS